MRFALILPVLVILARPALAALPLTDWAEDGGAVLSPAGFRAMCARDGQLCGGSSGGPDRVAMSADLLAQLAKFNADFNRANTYRTDLEAYGKAEYWTPSGGVGDCEDFALGKQQALIHAGWPRAALRLAVGRTPEGVMHTVLMVRSSQGDLVLDNRQPQVRTWRELGLEWLSLQNPDDPRYWRSLVRPGLS